MRIILATKNKGKIREFREALAEIGWEGVPLSEVADVPEPEETGSTFMENALQKARAYAEAVGMPVLSDDSGIIADVLGDEPGIYSARYAGAHGDDEANNQKLIERLRPYSGYDRRAHYVCAVALVFPDGQSVTAEGTCEGILRDFYAGTGGFGYDPLFYLPPFGKTMAEISLAEKNSISHRGKALRKLIEKIGKELRIEN